MKLNTVTDVGVIGADMSDRVALFVSLQAPDVPPLERAPARVVVVLDVSGSMGGPRLESAKTALRHVVSHLDQRDSFGLVLFDTHVDVRIPVGRVTDRDRLLRTIAGIRAGSMTNLSGGYQAGVEAAVAAAGGEPSTVILVSDGRANVGETAPDEIATRALAATGRGITTSTIGIGLGYQESLLAALARGGNGNHYFAENPGEAEEAFATEIGGLLDTAATGVRLSLQPGEAVQALHLLNDLRCETSDDGLAVVVGELFSNEERKLVFDVEVQGPSEFGITRLLDLRASWTDPTSGGRASTTAQVSLDVVSRTEAASRAVDEEVRGERELLASQRLVRRGAEAVAAGRFEEADEAFGTAHANLGLVGAVSAPLAEEIEADRAAARYYASEMRQDRERAAKRAYADTHARLAKRGRTRRQRDEREAG